jgi:methyl-accepting chemotaxis protein
LQDELKQIVDEAYALINAENDLADATFKLGEEFFNAGSEAAFTGATFQNVINTLREQSSSTAEFAGKLQGLYNSMIEGGFATAESLVPLLNIIKILNAELGVTTTKPITFDISNFTRGYDRARASVRSTTKATKELKEETREVAQEVRTLVDYASDLSRVFSRAFDIRFKSILNADKIADSWEGLAKRIDDAKKLFT